MVPESNAPKRQDEPPIRDELTQQDTARREGKPSTRYLIQVRGALSAQWAPTFANWQFTLEADPTRGLSLLWSESGSDQAQLHAVLRQIRDLGLELLSIERRAADD